MAGGVGQVPAPMPLRTRVRAGASFPFPEDMVDRFWAEVALSLQSEGRSTEPLSWGLCAADPDSDFPSQAAVGVPLGFSEELPRCPEILDENTSWPLEDLTGCWGHGVGGEPPVGEGSQGGASPAVRGRRASWRSARWRRHASVSANGFWSRLVARSRRAIAGRSGSCSTGRVQLKHWIRVMDRIRPPLDRGSASYLAEEGGARFALLIVIRKAHRQVLVVHRDWGLQAYRVEEGDGVIYVSRIGAFGVASASYWRGRLAAFVWGLVQYALGLADPIWGLVFSDGGAFFARGQYFERPFLLVLVLFAVLGIPPS